MFFYVLNFFAFYFFLLSFINIFWNNKEFKYFI